MKLRLFLLTAVLAASCQDPNGVGAKDTTHSQGPPDGFGYASNPFNLTVGVAAPANPTSTTAGAPVDSYSISPAALPAGLAFDSTTAQITGTPTTLTGRAEYIVTAYNAWGSRFTRLEL